MGIFGQLDSENIPDNPFFVEAGDYSAVVTDAFFQFNEKRDKNQFIIVYTIYDTSSKYHNKEVRDWFDFYPDMTEEVYSTLEPTEQAAVDEANSAIKRRLCGIPKLNRPGLGVDAADLTPDWDPKSLVNKEVDLGVVNSGDQNQYSNVKWVSVTSSPEKEPPF